MKQVEILQVKIDDIKKSDFLLDIKQKIKNNEKVKIFTINNEFIVEAQKNPEFKQALNNSTYSIADSTGIIWAAKRQGFKLEKLPGADLFYDLIKLAEENSLSIFLLGGSSGLGEKAVLKLKNKFPQIRVSGFKDGITINPNEENQALIDEINKTEPDLIFVSLGAPKQELFITNNFDKLNAKLFIGVGGTIDFISGSKKRAPEFLRKANLEWLFRLLIEPRRLRRILNAVVVFPLKVIFSGK